MKNIEAVKFLQNSGKKIFNLSEIKNLLDIEKDNTAYKKVESLIKADILKRTIKGIYYLTFNPPSDFELANSIYQPSYVSLASALTFYGILVQVPYEVTSVSPKLTKKIKFDKKSFTYSHISPDYFWGYQKVEGFLIALPEKALIDSLFFMSLGWISVNYDELFLDEIDYKKFLEMSKKIKNPVFHRFLKKIKL
ncbi:MAG: hypothetical protein H8D22_10800 [Candidatus Cloacimonetes bacterium]|nr:hypothetical protein [Candidatus Cloacimonadota bacterium]